MDTHPALRGAYYNTHLYARCPEFQQCPVCHMCENFNRHNPDCVECEDNKTGGRRHECSPQRILGMKLMEKKFGRPLFDPNAKPQQVDTKVMDSALGENAHILNMLQAEDWTKGR